MTDQTSDEAAHMADVDRTPDAHRATELDEQATLRDLYGPADENGIYRGDGV